MGICGLLTAFFVLLAAVSAVLVSNGHSTTNGIRKNNIQIVNVSEDVQVICGEAFQLNCKLNTQNTICVWTRKGTVIKQKDERYSFNSTFKSKDFTVCSFYAYEAKNIDNGSWTCGTQANDQQDGATSRNITVNLHFPDGNKCDASNATQTKAGLSIPYLIAYGSAGILTLLMTIIIILYCKRQRYSKDKSQQKSSDTDDIYVDGYSVDPREETTTSLARCQTADMTSSSSINISEIHDGEGYQVMVKPSGPSGSRSTRRGLNVNTVISSLANQTFALPHNENTIYFESSGANGMGKFVGKITFVNSYEDITEWA